MRREILGLKVSCTFQDYGCTWTGEVWQLEVSFVSLLTHKMVKPFPSFGEEG